jgi:acyl-CoA reductase-like NAD-dependent aldehyde dehydrogenase
MNLTASPPERRSLAAGGPEYQYIDGRWQESANADRVPVVNPATERVIAYISRGDARDIQAAVSAARAAFDAWAGLLPSARAGFLFAIADGLESRAEELAELVTSEVGCTRTLSRARQVAGIIFHFRAAATVLNESHALSSPERSENSLIVREPFGVVGAITPWNYPLIQIAGKVAYALAAGNTVVLKPSEVAPLCAHALFEVIHEAGLPAGVANLVNGEGTLVGEALTTHPDVDVISFTGSTSVGRRIASLAAGTIKRVALELGGNSPTLVTPDADLDRVAALAITNLSKNSGQTCAAQTRLIVPRSGLEEVELAVAAAGRSIRVGDPMLPETDMGPVVSSRQFERVRGYIKSGLDEGAKLVTGGLDRPEGSETGYFVQPTVFSEVAREMTIRNEEIFGPVLVIESYDSLDEGIDRANDTIYGLSAGVWARDQEEGTSIARRIRAGQVQVNGGKFNDLAPFGGYKQSGYGREFGKWGLEEFQQVKSIQL